MSVIGAVVQHNPHLQGQDGQPLATHALQFYWLAVADGFKYPVAYFLTKTATATELNEFVLEGLTRLADGGFDVLYLLSDGGSGNRSFFAVRKHAARATHPFRVCV